MKLSQLTLALAALSFAPSAFAGVLQLEDSAAKICSGSNCKVVSKGGKLAVEDRTANLITVGAGLRMRFGLFPVYVGELLVNDNKKYVCDTAKALDSLKDLSAIAMRLQFMRGIGMSDLQKAFNDGFDSNNVDVKRADVKLFMAAVNAGGDIPDGSVLSFVGEKLADGSEVVTYENAKGKAASVKGTAGFVRSIFALWLGNPGSDGGLKSLNKNLTTCQIK